MVDEADVARVVGATATPMVNDRTHADDGIVRSPVVRRLIAEHGLALGQITGTGEGGQITRKDVLEAITHQRVAAPPAEPPAQRG